METQGDISRAERDFLHGVPAPPNEVDEFPKALFLDDEQNILHLMKRLFRNDNMTVLTCSSGEDALGLLKCNDISVVVSDNLMPGMKGVEFLQLAKRLSPDTVRIMLTGYADIQAAMDAINKGEVYKFITKPCNTDELRHIVLQSIDRHKMVQSLRKADEHSLYSLAQTIELKDPYTKGHCERVAKYALSIAEALDLEKGLRENIRQGSWLHDCGKIGIPEAILNCNGPLAEDQMDIVKQHPRWGADVSRLAHLPDAVTNVILYHHERYDGNGYPYGLKGDVIPIEARVVNVADIYDALTSNRSYRKRMDQQEAIKIVTNNKGTCSDPRIVDAFLDSMRRTSEAAGEAKESMQNASRQRVMEEYLMNSSARISAAGRLKYL
jgi:putative two-component system response regulator